MNGNTKPYAILVFGVPMSGKTQFATKFCRQFKAPLLDFNTLHELYDLDQKAFITIISQVALSGQTLVIEGALDTQKQRTKLSNLLKKAGYQPVLIWVQTDVATVKRRLKAKLKSVEKAKTTFDSRIKDLEAPADSENPIVISGKYTFDTQLKTTLARLSQK